MRVIHAGPMRGGRAVLTSLALALPALAALVAAPASSAQAPEDFVPGTEAIILGPLTPTLQFTHEDFQKGFSRTYTFPRVPICTTPLCDSGGTIKLTYVPAPDAPIQVNLEYWEVYDCSQFEDEPKTQKVTYTWSDDLPLGLLADPDGVFPAAEFYDPTADVKRSRSGHCDVDQGGEGPMSIRLKLVHTNPYTGDVHRTAYLMLDDFHEWNARVFAGPPSEGEVEVAVTPPEDYDGWMPAGVVAASDTPGKQLTVHVKVHQKGDSASTGKAQLRFGFTEVSREKGVCLNWPTTGADTKPDLRLRFTDESLGQPSPEGTSIETSGLVEELDLIVESFDFGAWGTLRISGKDKNKRDVIVRVRGKQNPDLTIPLDEDGNRVPDAWMPEAARGRTADSDDEHQSGNPNDGDGLTLYEEWRGLVVNGGHRRTNPSKKDFFVRDLIDDQRSHDALALLADAADLEVHALALGEMDGSRVINPNSSSGVSQHGVILDTYDDPREDPDYSQVVPVVPGMASGTPRTISKILISQRNIDRPDRVPGEAYTDAAAEIAHELLHACSVRHHGENDVEKVEWRNRKTHADEVRNGGEPRQVEVLRENGSRYAFENADVITVWLASANGQHSGDVGCLMRYHRADAVYEAPASFGSGKLPVRYKADGGPIGLSLCRSAIGTGINSYDHKVLKAAGVATDFPRWGDAAAGRGDCWSQININDRH